MTSQRSDTPVDDMTVINLDVKRRPDPDDRDGHGRTRLHNLFYGLFECELSELQEALKAGCDVNAADNWGDTPLHTLIGSIMNDTARANLIRALLEAGANINAAGRRGTTPLHLAVERNRIESAQALLQAGANINTQNKAGDTPLREAVNGRNTDMVKLLLEHGADVGIKNRYGESPLQEAISNENVACAELLQQYGSGAYGNDEAVAAGKVPEPENEQGDETGPTDITAIGYSEAESAEMDRLSNPNARDGKGRTGFHELCSSYDASAGDLREALKAGADVNAADNWGNTPLHALVQGRSNNNAELVNILIEAGAKVDAVDYINRTALFDAVDRENTDCVQTLLQAGANVNARDKFGATPLREAIRKRDTVMLRLLLEHGAAVNTRDRFFETPLGRAERDNNFACAQILREHGAYAGIAGQIAMALRRIIGKPAAINPAKS